MGGKSARFSTSIERRGIFLRNILTNVKQHTRTWRPVLLGMLGSNLRMITTLSGQGPANSESKHTNQGPQQNSPAWPNTPRKISTSPWNGRQRILWEKWQAQRSGRLRLCDSRIILESQRKIALDRVTI